MITPIAARLTPQEKLSGQRPSREKYETFMRVVKLSGSDANFGHFF
jgi:hypothetical protein